MLRLSTPLDVETIRTTIFQNNETHHLAMNNSRIDIEGSSHSKPNSHQTRYTHQHPLQETPAVYRQSPLTTTGRTTATHQIPTKKASQAMYECEASDWQHGNSRKRNIQWNIWQRRRSQKRPQTTQEDWNAKFLQELMWTTILGSLNIVSPFLVHQTIGSERSDIGDDSKRYLDFLSTFESTGWLSPLWIYALGTHVLHIPNVRRKWCRRGRQRWSKVWWWWRSSWRGRRQSM